jgi:hypothetical protein
MPLSKSEWEEAESESHMVEAIRRFLEDNPSKAFSTMEIMYEHTDYERDDDSPEYIKKLIGEHYGLIAQLLVDRGEVEARYTLTEDEEGYEILTRYYRTKQ